MTTLFASPLAGTLGLLFFFAFFVGVVVMLLWPGAKEKAERDALIPFREEEFRG